MMRIVWVIGRIAVGVLLLVAVLLLLFGGLVTWERNRDALGAIDLPAGRVTLDEDTPYPFTAPGYAEREYRRIHLSTENLGFIEAFVSMPKRIPSEGLPVVIIMGGLEAAAEDFRHIPDPGANIYIIYTYPYAPEYWYRGTPLAEIPAVRNAALRVPAQALTLYEWAAGQPWAQQGRVTFAGFSFGAMFLPAVYHLGERRGMALNPGVLAYAGADISDLIEVNLEDRVHSPWREAAAWLIETAIYGVEPARHIPFVHSELLLINGTRDRQISPYSWKLLHRLAPEPKTVVILEEEHMHPRRPALTRKLVAISKAWLAERGVVNR
jgi:fermentation-respiration switch protein FrsA (DUF1100 family)